MPRVRIIKQSALAARRGQVFSNRTQETERRVASATKGHSNRKPTHVNTYLDVGYSSTILAYLGTPPPACIMALALENPQSQ